MDMARADRFTFRCISFVNSLFRHPNVMILTKTERGIAALADADIQKVVLRQRPR